MHWPGHARSPLGIPGDSSGAACHITIGHRGRSRRYVGAAFPGGRSGHTTRAPPAKFSTNSGLKRGRRQHQQELRRARARRKSDRTDSDIPRTAHWQPAAMQFRSPFPFAPPTAPTIPLAASESKGFKLFTFRVGAAVRSNPSAHGPQAANLSTSIEPRAPGRDTVTGTRSAFTEVSIRPTEVPLSEARRRGWCKPNGVRVIPSSDFKLLQPHTLPSTVDDSSVDDSDHASAASTPVPLLVTLLSLIRGLRPA
jgi:hypothetical protein